MKHFKCIVMDDPETSLSADNNNQNLRNMPVTMRN